MIAFLKTAEKPKAQVFGRHLKRFLLEGIRAVFYIFYLFLCRVIG